MNESELLFTELLKCDRVALYENRAAVLDKISAKAISSAFKRRIAGEPVQYILGKTEFMGLEFKVTPDVLIPRSETEILVETALRLAEGLRPRGRGLKIIDIGTGSGCIAVSLAKLLPFACLTATEISPEAMQVARENASLNNCNVHFILSDLFCSPSLLPESYDIIVSNPPYIPTKDIAKLEPEVQREPVLALDGGEDGLDLYRRIIKEGSRYLKGEGFLIMEMGFNQRAEVEELFKDSGNFRTEEIVKDYSFIERLLVARKRNG